MPRHPSEIVNDHYTLVEASNHPRCTLLKPITVHYEYMHDYVDQKAYWVTSAEEISDTYGTGFTEDDALQDLFEAVIESLEWYALEAADLNEILSNEYRVLCEYVRLDKRR